MRRIVVDTNVYVDWMNAGRHEDVLFEKQAERGYNLTGSPSLVGDVLIALSARAIGGVVITQNERDFRAIQSVRPFGLEIVAAA